MRLARVYGELPGQNRRGVWDYVEGTMIFEDSEGEGVRIDSSPRHDDLVDEVIEKFHRRGVPVADIARVLNRSETYIYNRLRRVRRDLSGGGGVVSVVPIFGANPHWSPEVEGMTGLCDRCGGIMGPIREGSPYVCLACLHSGRDLELEDELKKELKRAKFKVPKNLDSRTFAERHGRS